MALNLWDYNTFCSKITTGAMHVAPVVYIYYSAASTSASTIASSKDSRNIFVKASLPTLS